MAKRKAHELVTPAVPIAPTLVRVQGAPTGPGDYRVKLTASASQDEPRPEVLSVDSVDEIFIYGRPKGFFGMAGFKIDKQVIEWFEKLP
jgi:hypothetical protein